MRFALSVSVLLTTSALTPNLAAMSRWRSPARFLLEAGTVKDLSQICRCLGGAIGAIGLHPALLLFEQRYV